MRIAIYHPQLTTYGGGELISMVIASSLSRSNDVVIFSPLSVKKEDIESFFGVDLSRVRIRTLSPFQGMISRMPTMRTYKSAFYTREIMGLRGFDLIFDTGTNGLFTQRCRAKAACYINFTKFTAFKKGWKSAFNFLLADPRDAYKYDLIISNSNFTRKAVYDYSGGKDSIVIYPPVKISGIVPSRKRNDWIVSVGRFSPEKKHEVMIRAFRAFSRKNKGWELHLIGQFREDAGYSRSYYDSLKKEAAGLPVVFHENMPHDKVLEFVPGCRIYWHARGYGETDPVEMENFGMSTVEAMAGGCVPVAINLGAQPEIVENGACGYVWDTPDELIRYTQMLADSSSLWKRLSASAIRKSARYSEERFAAEIKKAVDSLF